MVMGMEEDPRLEAIVEKWLDLSRWPLVVVTSPDTALTGKEQERTGWPLTCTVQAPHKAMPQPNLVPFMPSFSRTTQRIGIAGSTSAEVSLPLRVKLAIAALSD